MQPYKQALGILIIPAHRPAPEEENACMEIITSSPCTCQLPRLGWLDCFAVDGTNGPSSSSPGPPDIITVELPEDVWRLIYSLMPLRDAARAACVSRRFLRFWRCYPNLTFNQETLAASRQPTPRWGEDRGRYLFRKTRQVLEKHSGVGVKKLRLNLSSCSEADVDTGLVDGWLRRAFVRPGVAELAVMLPDCCAHEYFNFPCAILSSSTSSSLESLHLASCGFHPTRRPRLLGCSRSLTRLSLSGVGVTGEELGFFLSRCLALQRLELSSCDMLTSLRIPRVLRKLRVVRVQMSRALQTVESEAPRLSTFHYDGRSRLARFSLGDSLETKELDMNLTGMAGMIQCAGTNLPSIAPNLETLVLSSFHERLKAPVMLDKFQKLKHLAIRLGEQGGFGTGYNFVSLAYFLDACPSLETFTLRIADGFAWYKKYVIIGKPDDDEEEELSTPQREIPELRHGGLGNLRKATITGFCSAKSLVELACHILETAAPSLQCLTLDASPGYDLKRSPAAPCCPMLVDALRDAERALAAVRTYVVPKVPAGVGLKVLGPCSRCHAMDAKAMQKEESRVPRRFYRRQADGSVALVIVLPRGTDDHSMQ